MSNSTISVTFKVNGDTNSFQMLAKDAEGLKKAMTSTISEADRLKKSVVNWSAASYASRALGDVVNQLTGAFKGLSDAYAVQAEGETRLATAMRNTMGASDAEIQSIKDLCSEQQRLGVIGDEVQLAGAQKLAAFVSEKSSLEALLPVMNDMVVQQYGFKASTEGAASVATILGKVMSGQVGALTRYGYTFTEAQKQVFKFGTESEKASLLVKILGERIGGMNADAAKTSAGSLVNFQNRLSDLGETAGGLVQKFMPFLTVTSQIALTATGFLQLSASLKAVSKAFNFSVIKQYAASLGMAYSGLVKMAVGGRSASVVMRSLSIAMGSAKAAATSMKVAVGGLVAIIGGALIAGISALVRHTRQARDEATSFTQSQQDLQERLSDVRGGLEEDIAKLKNFTCSQAEASAMVDEMNRKYGESFGQFSTTADWYDTLSGKIDVYCSKLAAEIQMQTLANDVAKAKIENEALASKMSTMPDTVGQTVTGAGVSYTTQIPNTAKLGIADRISANDAVIAGSEAKMKGYIDTISALNKELGGKPSSSSSGGTGSAGSAAGGLAGDIKAYETAVQSAVDVNAVFGSSSSALTAKLTAMRSGLESLIGKYGTSDKQINALVDDYYSLARAGEEASGKLPSLGGSLTGRATTEGGGLLGGLSSGTGVKEVDTAVDAVQSLSSAFGSLNNSMSGSTATWTSWISQLLSSVATAIPALTTLYNALIKSAAAKAADANAGIPIVGVINAAAAVAGIVATMASIPKFATGALVSGPTFGLMGEYPGASNNPEFIAPVNKLPSLLSPLMATAGGGEQTVRIKGEDLYYVLNRYGRRMGRS